MRDLLQLHDLGRGLGTRLIAFQDERKHLVHLFHPLTQLSIQLCQQRLLFPTHFRFMHLQLSA